MTETNPYRAHLSNSEHDNLEYDQMLNISSAKWAKQSIINSETDQLNTTLSLVASDINRIISPYTTLQLKEDDIVFSPNFLKERICPPLFYGKLRNFIFNYYCPQIIKSDLYHFTTLENFINIYKSNSIRLYSLMKRFKQDEFVTFYKDHDLLGYETNLNQESTTYKTLMNDIFYISFIRKTNLNQENEDDAWRSFGDDGQGVRCEFEVNNNSTDFRDVFYNGRKELIFRSINDFIKEKYNRSLFLQQVSKIGAFYLQGDFSTENETRFIVKKSTDSYSFDYDPIREGVNSYINLNFNNKFANFKLKTVCTKSTNTHQKLNKLLLKEKDLRVKLISL